VIDPRARAVDIVVPLYNEERMARRFHLELARVADALPCRVSIYYVDDGSTDGTAAVLESIAAADARVVVVELSRNFGHQAALSAGLDTAQGDVVITMDGDGQHPPELIPEMLKLFESG
jgi:glycosyltransferase involved in cell wall biosynthesis